MLVKTTIRLHPLGWLLTTTKSRKQGCEKTGTPVNHWWKYKIVLPLKKTV